MALVEQIQSDLTAAMKARDTETTATLRMVMAAVKNARVAPGQQGEISDAQALDILAKEAKKRAEAIEAYTQAGRQELADKEQAELAVIQRYLPQPLTEDEVRAIVEEAIAATGASGPGDMGKVMGAVTPQTKGRADGRLVSTMVKDRLAGA
ncbi:MAG TPA: GatB/YqeY domain-containing protein [Egibacteraceae bacterium]|nr:GatB/YqeY domain-containing protein [Egibacteraceae bacterium]